MDVTITERNQTLVVTTSEQETLEIPKWVIGGLCRTLVQGRDWEDGLAPIIPLAAMITEALGLEGYELGLHNEMDADNWLVCLGPDNIASEGITVLEIAIAHLRTFGGTWQAVDLVTV